MRYLFTFCIAVFLIMSGHAQIAYRLASMAHYGFNPANSYLQDSFIYQYSNGRGGNIPEAYWHSLIDDDSADVFMNHMIPELKCDAIVRYGTNNSGQVFLWKNYYQHMNANNNIDTFRHDIARDAFSYAGNKLVEDWGWNRHKIYKYNTSGQLDTVLDMYNDLITIYGYSSFDLVQKLTYHNGNNIAAVNYTYSGGRLSIEETGRYDMSAIFHPSTKYSYTYTSAGDMEFRTTQKWNDTTATWQNYIQRSYTYDASHRTIAEVYMPWHNAWDTSEQYTFNYNSVGNIDSIVFKSWFNGTWQQLGRDSQYISSDQTYKLYYEPYFPTSIIRMAQNNSSNINIYPVPASDVLTIVAEQGFSTSFTSAIYDMRGRLVRSWIEPATQNYSRTIPIADIVSGTYVLKLSAADTDIVKQFSISR